MDNSRSQHISAHSSGGCVLRIRQYVTIYDDHQHVLCSVLADLFLNPAVMSRWGSLVRRKCRSSRVFVLDFRDTMLKESPEFASSCAFDDESRTLESRAHLHCAACSLYTVCESTDVPHTVCSSHSEENDETACFPTSSGVTCFSRRLHTLLPRCKTHARIT